MTETKLPYEAPSVSSHTEAELLASMEVWGASGGTVEPYS